MDNPLRLLLGAGLGAATMYYLDPARGRYRRALVRNQLVHATHLAQRSVRVIGRDACNRAIGTVASLRSSFADERVPDDVLLERVRACLGRAVTHPASVHVEARDGVVTLTGPILDGEIPMLLGYVRAVPGVTEVRNELEAHPEPGRIPGLQGTPRPRAGSRTPFMQANWSPTERGAAALGGAVLALYGFGRRGAGGTLLGGAGLLLLGRAVTNMEIGRLLGTSAARQAVDVQKSIRIHAPVERVFELWDDFENFPQFMTHVRHVRRLPTEDDRARWRWTVRAPSGMEVEFDSCVTAREPNRLLAWHTEDGAFVRHDGVVRFVANDDGSTTVDVKMVYTPVAGALGHAVAWLIGADPKHQMDDDLLRMKTFLETGKPPRDAAEHASATEPLPEQAEPSPAAASTAADLAARM